MTRQEKVEFKIIFLGFILTLLLSCYLSEEALAQGDKCSKPRVDVRLKKIHKEVFDVANEKYPKKSKEDRLKEIQNLVLIELIRNSPDTQFIQSCGDDCDYIFYYEILSMGIGDNIEAMPGIVISQYVGFVMVSGLTNNEACELPGWLVHADYTKDRDLYYLIRRNIESFGDIGKLIEEHEITHPVPPRGPELEVSQKQDYVSPLENETKLDIKIDVTNCKGEPVFGKFHKQRVILPKETERGELWPTKPFPQDAKTVGTKLWLLIREPAGASATYILVRGIKPDKEPIKIITCGRDKRAIEETEIQIYGLEIEVTPHRKKIYSGEKTKIEIKLSKVGPEGDKKPAAGQQIQLNINGLVDGSVTPSGEIVTGESGKAILTYHAGDKDKSVTFDAKYQPKDFAEFVKDKAIVDVSHLHWNVEINYNHIGTLNEPEDKGKRLYTLKIIARLEPRRKKEQPSFQRGEAYKQMEMMRKYLESGQYDDVLDDATKAQLEQGLGQLTKLADDVGGLRLFASKGAKVSISDLFNRTDTRFNRTEKWHWSSQIDMQQPLNIGLDTFAADNEYGVSIGTMDPDGVDQEDVLVYYQYRASRHSNPPSDSDFECSGAQKVDLVPLFNLFAPVPDEMLTYVEHQKKLNGTYTWTSRNTLYADVGRDAFGFECKEGAPLVGDFQFKHTLSWKIERE